MSMASDPVLSFDALLAPISDEAPTGPDLREDYSPDAVFREIAGAAKNARKIERTLVEDPESVTEHPDWRPVLEKAPTVLEKQSKDLELASCLAEALLRARGFAGLRDGFRLCRELAEKYWEALHPLPDPDEPVDENEPPDRVAAMVGWDGGEATGTLIQPLRAVSLVESSEFGPLGVAAYERAAKLETLDGAERERELGLGVITLSQYHKAVADSSAAFYEQLLQDFQGMEREFEALATVMVDKCGSYLAPPVSNIQAALDACRLQLHENARTKVPHLLGEDGPGGSDVEAGDNGGDGLAGAGTQRGSTGPAASREQAFDLIRQASAYFKEHEPHSVLSWQLDECVRWGKMSLPDLLSEIISDTSALDEVCRRVGIRHRQEDEFSE